MVLGGLATTQESDGRTIDKRMQQDGEQVPQGGALRQVEKGELFSEGGRVGYERPMLGPASVDVRNVLSRCHTDDVLGLEEILDDRIKHKKCKTPLPLGDAMCKLGCDQDEPELEETFRLLRLSQYPIEYLGDLCRRHLISALVWFDPSDGPKYYVCGPKLHGKRLFATTRAVLSLVACIANIPNVLFGLDNQDWPIPHSDQNEFGWIQPLPGVLRYTGVPSHPAPLLPTAQFIRSAVHCNLENNPLDYTVCRFGETSACAETTWNRRKATIFWRGSATGSPLDPVVAYYLPRPALVKQYRNERGFDVGFVNGPPPSRDSSFKGFFKESVKDFVKAHGFCKYKFLVHCDGHTASWGLAQKLLTRSLVLLVPSHFHYREFFYVHLKPWEHFVPAEVPDLATLRDWLSGKSAQLGARQIAENAFKLFHTRLRPEATYCYLIRLLFSLESAQETPPTKALLAAAGFPVDKGWIRFAEYEQHAK